jgi:ADP-heptose:LPS heptosyltransferase
MKDFRRSIALSRLAPLARHPGIGFVSLQKGEAASQLVSPPAGLTVHDAAAELRDLADTAALVATLDLVISVDTSVAHLAGALGKPVWLLNRFDTDWRWLQEGERTAWYPTMRIFRQPRLDDWDSAIDHVGDELARWAASLRHAT